MKCVKLLAALSLGLVACATPPADPNGVWSGQVTEQGGGAMDLVLDLRAGGDSLTGSVSTPGDGARLVIEHGKIDGSHLSFEVNARHPDAPSDRFTVTATIAGNQMRGSVANPHEGITMPFTLTKGRAAHAPTRSARDTGPPNPKGRDPEPVDARKGVLAAFDDHEVVGLGILSYANQDFDDFILGMIRDPAFPQTVNDIVVECGNSLYQDVLDRYTAGEDIPLSEVQQVWRNTTQPMCGLASFYEQLFPLVRQINAALPADRKLRVLAGDPPIDWSNVRSRDDLRPFRDRDASIAAVVQHEVLLRHRKALMIFGVRHLLHGGGGAVGMYERKIENGGGHHLTYVVMAHNGFGNHSLLTRYNDTLEQRLASWPVPSLVELRGSWLADLDYGYFFPDESDAAGIAARVDAYLYLGPRALLLNQPISAVAASDTAYMRELARRATIERGPTTPADILRGAVDSTVFFNARAGQPGPEALPAAAPIGAGRTSPHVARSPTRPPP
ncbi:MAG TPA: hypothetical protein VFL88_03895 [Gemmatimonadales bacterium]|jgi:hypothetical protein|nr:hypothetical protein [Gemmatimonadales bacterium]